MLGELWSFQGRYRTLHLTWFEVFLTFIVWFNLAPLATTVKADLGLTLSQIRTVAICNVALTIPARVLVTDKIRKGTVFLPMHWGFTQTQACEVNALMHDHACPISKQPELKASAVIVAPAVSVIKPIKQQGNRLKRLRRMIIPAFR
jgi:hypothetical protein